MLFPLRHWALALLGFATFGILVGCGGGTTPASPTPSTVTLRVVDRLNTPTDTPFVAFRDGDGAWTVLAHTAVGTYTAEVTDPQGRYSLAIHDTDPQARTWFYHATLAEAPVIMHRLASGEYSGPTHSMTVDVEAEAPEQTFVRAGLWVKQCGPGETTLEFTDLPEDTYNVLGMISTPDYQNVTAYKVIPNVALSSDTRLDLDMTSATWTPDNHTVTINGVVRQSSIVLGSNTLAGITIGGVRVETDSPTYTYNAPPAAIMDADDRLTLICWKEAGGHCTHAEGFRTAVDKTFNADAIAPFSGSTVTDGIYGWTAYPGVTAYLICHQDMINLTAYLATITPGYIGASRQYTFPDLSALPAWDAAWAPLSPDNEAVSVLTTSLTSKQCFQRGFFTDYGNYDGCAATWINDAIDLPGAPAPGRTASPEAATPWPFMQLPVTE